ncbi:hypothetical protein GBA52_016915 [Prunus armeniaca]|nr:hypothetical protein GBA52_016915 [Prunus armeniaca]
MVFQEEEALGDDEGNGSPSSPLHVQYDEGSKREQQVSGSSCKAWEKSCWSGWRWNEELREEEGS